jgi:hypothetical protein
VIEVPLETHKTHWVCPHEGGTEFTPSGVKRPVNQRIAPRRFAC